MPTPPTSSRYPLLSEAQWRDFFRLPPEAVSTPESAERQQPNAEIVRLRRELSQVQAELKRLRTPQPREQIGAVPMDALP